MIEVKNLSTSYRTMVGFTNVLKDVNFTVRDNEIFGIAGESGCGKTTLLKVLYDLIDYPLVINRGEVVLSGEYEGKSYEYHTGKIKDAWWNRISYVPQAAQSVLNPILKVKEHFIDSLPRGLSRSEQAHEMEKVSQYLEALGLSRSFLDAYAFQLSGGMRQRMVIALATYMRPDFVLADEPTTALDVVVQKEILKLLMRLQEEHENSLVVVTHDMGVHYQITDRMGVMYSGHMVEIAETEDIFTNALHPYTKMLVDALPKVGDSTRKVGIPGRPPSLLDPPRGCRFAERCPSVMSTCHLAAPAFVEVEPGRHVACYLYDEVVEKTKELEAMAHETA